MARPKTLKNRIPLITNVEVEFKQHLERVAEKISEETGKLITVSEIMRIALERVFPVINYSYLYPDEWPLNGKKEHKKPKPKIPRRKRKIQPTDGETNE